MDLKLRVWRQEGPAAPGKFEEYDVPGMKTVNGIATGGDARAAWFKDSEGNILAVIQTLDGHEK